MRKFSRRMPFSASAGTATFTGSPAARQPGSPAALSEFVSAASAGISMRERPTMVLGASALDTFSTSPVTVNGPAAAASARQGRGSSAARPTAHEAELDRFGLGLARSRLASTLYSLASMSARNSSW
ncbi:hypothetical protein [Cryobacterium sp. Y50]|uniref:hypothetical protein n=1 Tax=Cryobacterium sp. Y50 TaxID=2048286 RepID=UPI0011B0AA8E|nr:hypothetical protein [Cryobacterium sp. Y50]